MTGVQQLPVDMIGLAGLLIIVLGGVIRLALNQRVQLAQMKAQAEQLDAQSVQIRETHEQVRNDHPESPNMRDTIDDIVHRMDDMRATMRDVQDRTISHGRDLTAIRVDISGVRHELHDEIDRSKAADKQNANELRDERQRSIIADAELGKRIDGIRPPPEP